MREKDIAEKIYLSSKERFAGFHNGVYGAGISICCMRENALDKILRAAEDKDYRTQLYVKHDIA